MATKRAAILPAAYGALGVSPNAVLLAPKITPLLSQIGTKAEVLALLRASSEPAARAFILCYDDPTLNSQYRRALPYEAFCIAAKIDPTDLLAPITRVAHLQGAMLGAVKAARSHPAIVDASLAAAVKEEFVEDRMANLKHMGYLPSPKGATINVNASASANAAAAAKSEPALAAPEDTIRRIIEARQRSAALPAGTPAALPAPATVEVVPFMPKPDRELVAVEADSDED